MIAVDIARDPRVGLAWVHGKPTADTVRLRADDLIEAMRAGRRLRAQHAASGADPGALQVLVDIEIHIAPVSHQARAELAAATPPQQTSMRYIGTPAGLVGLVADVHAAAVADGVVLVPVLTTDLVRVLTDLAAGASHIADRCSAGMASGCAALGAH